MFIIFFLIYNKDFIFFWKKIIFKCSKWRLSILNKTLLTVKKKKKKKNAENLLNFFVLSLIVRSI